MRRGTKRKLRASMLIAAAMVLGIAAGSGAVDGTIEINQAVMNAVGFPYKISAPGSYRLTSNLTVSSSSTDAIDVNPNGACTAAGTPYACCTGSGTGTCTGVTIDLNGFTIAGVSSGYGIRANTVSNVTVKNGVITKFNFGVELGSNGVVSGVQAVSNADGIITGNYSLIEGCAANSNTSVGLFCLGSGCVISNNTATGNAWGSYTSGSESFVNGNILSENTTDGIFAADASTGWGWNVMWSNGTNHVGGTSTGHNLCNGVVC